MSNLRALPQITKIVYHGTDAIFDRLDETKKGSNTGFLQSMDFSLPKKKNMPHYSVKGLSKHESLLKKQLT